MPGPSPSTRAVMPNAASIRVNPASTSQRALAGSMCLHHTAA